MDLGGREGEPQQINAPLRREEQLLVVRMEATLCEIAPCQEQSVHDVFLLGHAEPYASTSAPPLFPPLQWILKDIPALVQQSHPWTAS